MVCHVCFLIIILKMTSTKFHNFSKKTIDFIGQVFYNDTSGNLHNLNGPAWISADKKSKEYYIHGERIMVNSDEEFIRYVKLFIFT